MTYEVIVTSRAEQEAQATLLPHARGWSFERVTAAAL